MTVFSTDQTLQEQTTHFPKQKQSSFKQMAMYISTYTSVVNECPVRCASNTQKNKTFRNVFWAFCKEAGFLTNSSFPQ